MPLETSKRETKRDELFRAALKVMGKQGFKDASVRDITKEAGVTRSVFYYYFESKGDLVEKMVRESNEALFKAFNEAVEPGMDTETLLRTVSQVLYTRVSANSAVATFIFSEVWHHEEPWRKSLGNGMNEAIAVFGEIIEVGQEEGIFDPAFNVSFVSQMIFAMIATTAAACHEGYIDADCGNIGEQVVRFMTAGLAIQKD